MRVISKKKISDAMKTHPEVKEALFLWLKTFNVNSLRFESFAQVTECWRKVSAKNVDRIPCRHLAKTSQKGPLDIYVFDMNHYYRLICWVNSRNGYIYVKDILSHAEYDKWCRKETSS